MKAKLAAVRLELHLCAPRLPRAGSSRLRLCSGGGDGDRGEGPGRGVLGLDCCSASTEGFGGEGRRPRREDEAAGVLRLKTEQ